MTATRDRLIGTLLDRWEMTPNDLKQEMREHGCGKQLDELSRQVEAPSPETRSVSPHLGARLLRGYENAVAMLGFADTPEVADLIAEAKAAFSPTAPDANTHVMGIDK